MCRSCWGPQACDGKIALQCQMIPWTLDFRCYGVTVFSRNLAIRKVLVKSGLAFWVPFWALTSGINTTTKRDEETEVVGQKNFQMTTMPSRVGICTIPGPPFQTSRLASRIVSTMLSLPRKQSQTTSENLQTILQLLWLSESYRIILVN